MEPITAAASNAANTVSRAIWGENPSGETQEAIPGPATGDAPDADESHSSRDVPTDSSPANYTSEGGPPKDTDRSPDLPFPGSIEGVSSLGGKDVLKDDGSGDTGSRTSLGETETEGCEASSSGTNPDIVDHSPLWLGKTEHGNHAPGDLRPGDNHPTETGRSSDSLGETELGKTQQGHTELGHSSYATDTTNRTPSDITSGTQGRHEGDALTSDSSETPPGSELSGRPSLNSIDKPRSSSEPTRQSGLRQPPALAQTTDTPSRSVSGSSGDDRGTAFGTSVDAPPSTGDPPVPKQQGADKPLSKPSSASAPVRFSSHPAPSAGNPLMGGIKLNNETTGQGTGMKYEKSTGLAADGGDFDATRPGAGREADRLLEEKGIHRAHGGSTNLEDERAKKEARDLSHPNFSASSAQSPGHKEHEKLTTKIKEKLHIGHHH